METFAGAAGDMLKADVVVTSNPHGVFTFHPINLRCAAWLAREVPREYHVDGRVVMGPLGAAKLAVRMGIDGLVIT